MASGPPPEVSEGSERSQPSGSSPDIQRPCSAARLGMLGRVGLPQGVPLGFRRRAPLQCGAPVGQGVFGNVEGGLRRPPHDLLGAPHFLGAERRAVRVGGVALRRRRIGDVGPEYDQRRAIGLGAGGVERGGDPVEVVAVTHPDDVPAVRFEPALDVLGEGEGGVAVNGDVVVVVQHRELAEPQVPGEGGGLAGHALHQVAIAREGPGPMVHDRVSRPVEMPAEEALGDGHPDRVREALAQGAGRGLDSRRVPPLGMPGSAGAPLPEGLDLLDRQIVPAQVEGPVQQHRGMAARQDKAVSIGPGGIGGVVAEEPGPEDVGGGGQCHRRPGVAGLGRLHGIHRQDAHRVDAAPGELGVGCIGIAKDETAIGVRGPGVGALCGQNRLLSSTMTRMAYGGGKLTSAQKGEKFLVHPGVRSDRRLRIVPALPARP